jgi:hypothetical protein
MLEVDLAATDRETRLRRRLVAATAEMLNDSSDLVWTMTRIEQRGRDQQLDKIVERIQADGVPIAQTPLGAWPHQSTLVPRTELTYREP